MKPKIRAVLARCIETGILRGINRAHKHTETPPREVIQGEIEAAIWMEIDDYFDFDEVE